MNIYDFDGTIYRGDSTVDFYLYLLKKHPIILLSLPIQLWAAVKHKAGKCSTTAFKENFFSFLPRIPDISKEAEMFWEKNIPKIAPWYLSQKKEDDLIISASPVFLLEHACRMLGDVRLIASQIDPKTGKFSGKNCKGEEKVRRLFECYPDATVDAFYSDSHSDLPLAKLAKKAFFVKKNKILEWNM